MKSSKLNINKSFKTLSGLKIAVVSTFWNEEVILPMLKDCLTKSNEYDLETESFVVPGAYELPLTAKCLYKTFDAVILLGCSIKGETPQFEIISQSISDNVLRTSLEEETPIIFGVLTTNNLDQAIERAGKKYRKGKEFALTSMEMLSLTESLDKQ